MKGMRIKKGMQSKEMKIGINAKKKDTNGK